MNCLDCSTESRASAAVGVCTTCGAGVCTSHLELDTHVTAPFVGVGSRREYPTRAVTCASCAPVMAEMHHHRYTQAPTASPTGRR